MWRKLLFSIVTVVITFSIAYAYYDHSLSAATSSYHAGGNVTGRINKAPSNLSVNQVEFQKGDRILLGTMNPEYNEPISLQLIEEATYTSYNCPVYDSTCTQPQPITSWLAITMKPIGHTTTGITTSDYINNGDGTSYALYTNSKLYQEIERFNRTLNIKVDILNLSEYRCSDSEFNFPWFINI